MNEIYSSNKKAKFDYIILEKYEAGLLLEGQEVKSIRKGSANLKGGFINFYGPNAFLVNAHIPKYKFAGKLENYDPTRSRQLLLKAKEITYLRGKSQEKGLTIVPLSLYNKGRHIKLELAVVRGKKQYDKRESSTKRELSKETARAMKKVL